MRLIHTKQKHGMSKVPEYRIWAGMIVRCENEMCPEFKHYGGRGIKVCERWRQSFAAFISDVGRRPSSLYQLDRHPDNNGNYEPGNVRWATRRQQGRNTRRNRIVRAFGSNMTVAELSERTGVPKQTIAARLDRGCDASSAIAPKRDHWKLSDEEIAEIREAYRFRSGRRWGMRELAAKYGISREHCWHIATYQPKRESK